MTQSKMTRVRHPDPSMELWIDLNEIILMERYTPPPSMLIQLNEHVPKTAIVLRNGKVYACMETPEELNAMRGVTIRV
jgi:hypothetical protein